MPQPAVLFHRLLLALYISVLFATSDAFADLEAPVPFDFLVGYSDIVVHARIDSAKPQMIDGVKCGTRYTATIITTFKQNPAEHLDQQLTFGRLPGLEVGQSYLLFLNRISDEDFYETRLSIRPEPRDFLMRVAQCNGLAPGLQQTTSSIWKVTDEKVEIEGVLPSPWPNAVPMHRRSEPRAAIASREYLFSYLKNWKPARVNPSYR